MKKQILHCSIIFLLYCSVSHAQKVKLGAVSENFASELLATDPVQEKKHYKSMSYTLKAGNGIVFYMYSSAFTPSIFMTSKDGKQVGSYNIPEKGTNQDATVSMNAFRKVFPNYIPVDTIINIFFYSAEENATGKFNYGYIMLDSAQMIYDLKGPLCNRLIYLINQWQAGWCLIPTLRPSTEPHGGGNRGATNYTLLPDKTGDAIGGDLGGFYGYRLDMTCSYNETLFSSTTDNGSEYYQKLITELKQCLGDKEWTFRTEVKEDKDLKEKYSYTFFQIKGAAKDQARTQFVLVKITPEKPESYNPYEVVLHFN